MICPASEYQMGFSDQWPLHFYSENRCWTIIDIIIEWLLKLLIDIVRLHQLQYVPSGQNVSVMLLKPWAHNAKIHAILCEKGELHIKSDNVKMLHKETLQK